MGFDFYIIKNLNIRYLTEDNLEVSTIIEYSRERMYFRETFSTSKKDSDDESSSESDHEDLKVTYIPRKLYQNGKWESDKIQKKYEDFVQYKINQKVRLIEVEKYECRPLKC